MGSSVGNGDGGRVSGCAERRVASVGIEENEVNRKTTKCCELDRSASFMFGPLADFGRHSPGRGTEAGGDPGGGEYALGKLSPRF
jgi:hypothetical protein